jgi:hypothetical protein
MMKTRVFEPWFNDRSTSLPRRTCGMLCVVIGGAGFIAAALTLW